MHLDDERIQRVLHGELGESAQEAARRHAAECAACRLKLAEAAREEEWLFGLLRRIDRAAPVADADAVARRAGARAVLVWARRAAGLVLALAAAGVAYTTPGSPLPRWMDRVTGWIAHREPPAPPPANSPEPAPGGIAVAPGPRLTIRFTTLQDQGVAAVSLTDGPNVEARTVRGSATFTTDVDRLVIENHGSAADYEIDLPRRAPWIEIVVGDRRVLLLERGRVLTEAPADAHGRHLLRLSPGP